MDWNAIFEWIGRATFFATPIGLAIIWFGRTYIDKWLAKRFQGQLDALKHAQAQEIERVRGQISGRLSRSGVIHTRELEFLPEIWARLRTALADTSDCLNTRLSYEDISGYDEETISLRMKIANYSDDAITAVLSRSGQDRQARWRLESFRHSYLIAANSHKNFNNFFQSKSVLIPAALREKLRAISALMQTQIYATPEQWRRSTEDPGQFVANYQSRAIQLEGEIQDLMFERLTDPEPPVLTR